MAASSSFSSSSASMARVLLSPQVFINFRGIELRDNFISHLAKAFEESDINFFADKHLVASERIETLFQHIEESKIALTVFSKRYTESKWCLNELVKIMENEEKGKLRVIPIFFNVTVENVKSQTGDFGDNLKKSHSQSPDMPKWLEAMTSVTAILGKNMVNYSDQSEFIVDIVKTVKVVQEKVSQGGERTDMFSRNISSVTSSGNILSETIKQPIREQLVKELEEKLFDFSYKKKSRIVGIVGMPGIGKTTLAETYFNKGIGNFTFNKNISGIREKSKEHGSDWLKETLLNGEANNDKAQMFTKKILLVLDDVSHKDQVEFLLQNRHRIAGGSKIIITTRDKSSIEELVDDTYVVPGLDDKEALQLFNHHAKGNFPELSKKFVEYAGGNPLALEELGKELCGKEEDHWEARLETLPHRCNPKILTELRFSYDRLSDQQKDTFLDIACFFRTEEEDYVKCLLDPYVPDQSGEAVRELAEKLLICISAGRIEMHNLLCTLGKELGSSDENKSGKRMWNHDKTIETLWSEHVKKEKHKVRGIFLDTSKFEENKGKALDAEDFIDRFNPQYLRYLKIYDSLCPQQCKVDCKVNLPEGLKFPFEEIRYFHWLKFPLEDELPSDFNPKNLIDLRLPYSKIERIWKATKETPQLKWVDLSFSTNLSDLSALSKAFFLRRLNLEGCTNLSTLPREMKNMKSLVFMNLRGCVMLTSLPRKLHLISLKTLILSGCSKFDKFDLNSENLEYLHLDGTAIKSLPKSIKYFQKLVLLNLKDCKMLVSLPYNLYKLKALEELILSGCVLLTHFPDIKENMENLQILLLDGTSIEEIPNMLLHCVKIKDQVVCQLPIRMNGMSLLRRLCLSRNKKIFSLGYISQLYHLKWIDLKYCESLQFISTLPPNLQCLDAHHCSSLKTVATPLALLMPTTQQVPASFIFTNCGKLEQAAKNEIVCYAHNKSRLLSEALNRQNKGLAFETLVATCFPGSEVPAWFSHKASGAELKPELPGHWSENGSVGIALCAIVSFEDYKTRNNNLQLKCRYEFNDVKTPSSTFNCHIGGLSETGDDERTIKSTHVFIGYTNWLDIKTCQEEDKKCVPTKASINFQVTDGTNEVTNCEVLKCGFSLVYESSSWEASLGTECITHCEGILSGFLRGIKWLFK